ncbi:hypothetical protein RESH_04296 [Rhodopirellula europaea SH398]|uniref:Uncharacterized protein n=1 Tax=Rhodopirellula europaea SH398 TaxID=1263868 RepID=M5S0N4_9BACT|nr:hypothetical protein RESH_04296 [Rhodopirellula europaea SH398]
MVCESFVNYVNDSFEDPSASSKASKIILGADEPRIGGHLHRIDPCPLHPRSGYAGCANLHLDNGHARSKL